VFPSGDRLKFRLRRLVVLRELAGLQRDGFDLGSGQHPRGPRIALIGTSSCPSDINGRAVSVALGVSDDMGSGGS
jgi:hypothetical protein